MVKCLVVGTICPCVVLPSILKFGILFGVRVRIGVRNLGTLSLREVPTIHGKPDCVCVFVCVTHRLCRSSAVSLEVPRA